MAPRITSKNHSFLKKRMNLRNSGFIMKIVCASFYPKNQALSINILIIS